MEARGQDERRFAAIQTLLRVRDVELRQAEGAFQRQQRKVYELQSDVLRLKKRCEQIRCERDGDVLRQRRALDALVRMKMSRTSELERAKREASSLLPALYGAQGRRDAVYRLWSRRRLDRDTARLRRQETEAADLAAARVRERRVDPGNASGALSPGDCA